MARPKFRIELRPSVEKDFRQIPQSYHRLIWSHIEALTDTPFPHGCLKLEGDEDLYRIRVGVYRIFYSVDKPSNSVWIEYIRHRQSAYKR